MKSVWLISLLILIPWFAKNQPATIIVADAESQTPISFAYIINTTQFTGNVTDYDGKCSIEILDNQHSYKFSCLGYQSLFITGTTLLNSDTIFLTRQVKQLNEVVVNGKSISPEKRLKLAYRTFKKQDNTQRKVFIGFYEEEVIDTSHIHELQCVFVMTNYDNHHKFNLLNLMDFSAEFVLLGIRMNKHRENPCAINGLRWVADGNTVPSMLGQQKLKNRVIQDSISQDGDNLIYWLTVLDKNRLPKIHMAIDDHFRFRYLESITGFCSKMVFDPAVSFQYPMYAYAYVPVIERTEKGKKVKRPECFYRMLLLEELEHAVYPENDQMPGEKLYDKESKSMWKQTAIQKDFSWDKYENVVLSD